MKAYLICIEVYEGVPQVSTCLDFETAVRHWIEIAGPRRSTWRLGEHPKGIGLYEVDTQKNVCRVLFGTDVV